MTNQFGQPIVQGAGHIIGTKEGVKDSRCKCALYEDSDGNFYCTAALIPLDNWLCITGCNGYEQN